MSTPATKWKPAFLVTVMITIPVIAGLVYWALDQQAIISHQAATISQISERCGDIKQEHDRLAKLFPTDMKGSDISHLLRPKTMGALIADEDRIVECRGLRFELDRFGNVENIRPRAE